jgi:hypothetical protein
MRRRMPVKPLTGLLNRSKDVTERLKEWEEVLKHECVLVRTKNGQKNK